MHAPAAASRSTARPFIHRFAAAVALLGVFLAQPLWAASLVDGIVVRYRDGVVAKSEATLTGSVLQRAGTALQTDFVPAGRTRDGAFKLSFMSPLPIDEARAALNRLRLDGDVLYADLARVASLPLRGAGTLGVRLAAHRESVYLARQLTRIACDLSLGASPSTLRRQLPDLPALGALYDRLGFGSFLRRQAERLAQLPEAQATPSAA